ncbi:MAG: DUF5684 domain-containing protein [Chloroflexota bacterium]
MKIGDLVITIIYLCVLVLMIASMWRIYTKAGKPGWAIFIPFYNIYVSLKIAGKPGWWLILAFIPLVNIIIAILVAVGVATNFGKGGGFAVGLILLPFIFYPILAFGEARYQGTEGGEKRQPAKREQSDDDGLAHALSNSDDDGGDD